MPRPAVWLALGLLGVGLYGAARDRARYPFTFDSANLIEASRNVMQGVGYEMTPPAFAAVHIRTEPVRLWPPGYSLLMMAGGIAGLDLPTSAVWLTRLCTGALLLSMILALVPLLGRLHGLVVAGLIVTAPGVLEWGTVALTDTPFLLVVVWSGILLFRGVASPDTNRWALVGAGMLAGAAFWLRNAAVAVAIATVAAAAVAVLLRFDTLTRVWTALRWWAGGALLVALPLWIRNAVVLGAMNPYAMPPSTRGYYDNARDVIAAMLSEMTGVAVGGSIWSIRQLMLLAAGLAVAAATIAGVRAGWPRLTRGQHWLLAWLVWYAGIGCAMLVQARSTYEWGEPISQRHTLQYAWAALAVAAFGVLEIARRAPRTVRLLVPIAVVLLAGTRVASAADNLRVGPSSPQLPRFDGPRVSTAIAWRLYDGDPSLARLVRTAASRGVVLSNASAPLKIRTGIGIRELPLPTRPEGVLAALSRVGDMGTPAQPVSVLLFPVGTGRLSWPIVLAELRRTGPLRTGLCTETAAPYVLVLRTCGAGR